MTTRTKIHTVYKDADDKRVPSVTTILGILNKPALLTWAWQCGIDGLDYRAVRDDAAGVGTLAHYLILCDIKGETPDMSEYSQQNIDKAETCLIKYWDWKKAHTVETILAEASLVSELYKFGGTIDFYGIVDDVPSLVDFKTGKAVYDEAFYQVAAYTMLLDEAGKIVNSIRILRIGRDETEGFEERNIKSLELHKSVFLNCLNIYRLQGEIRRL